MARAKGLIPERDNPIVRWPSARLVPPPFVIGRAGIRVAYDSIRYVRATLPPVSQMPRASPDGFKGTNPRDRTRTPDIEVQEWPWRRARGLSGSRRERITLGSQIPERARE